MPAGAFPDRLKSSKVDCVNRPWTLLFLDDMTLATTLTQSEYPDLLEELLNGRTLADVSIWVQHADWHY